MKNCVQLSHKFYTLQLLELQMSLSPIKRQKMMH